MGPQRRVGIDRHGMRHEVEERQVVQRIAVEPALVVGEPVAALSVSAPSVRYTPDRVRLFLRELRSAVAGAEPDLAR